MTRLVAVPGSGRTSTSISSPSEKQNRNGAPVVGIGSCISTGGACGSIRWPKTFTQNSGTAGRGSVGSGSSRGVGRTSMR